MSKALEDIAAERARQISQEGWTPEHDDAHEDGALAKAAAVYALHAVLGQFFVRWWPWDASWFKPTTGRRDLVKSGALIVAEIERMDRVASNTKPQA